METNRIFPTLSHTPQASLHIVIDYNLWNHICCDGRVLCWLIGNGWRWADTLFWYNLGWLIYGNFLVWLTKVFDSKTKRDLILISIVRLDKLLPTVSVSTPRIDTCLCILEEALHFSYEYCLLHIIFVSIYVLSLCFKALLW